MTTYRYSIQRTLNQFRINARRPCCYCNPVIIGLIDVCARRLNVVAMLLVTSYKTCLCHYITGRQGLK